MSPKKRSPNNLTSTQLVLLSAAAQREDRAIELAPNLKGAAADKVVGKLLRDGLIEEIPARGALPIWRRDEDKEAVARFGHRTQDVGVKTVCRAVFTYPGIMEDKPLTAPRPSARPMIWDAEGPDPGQRVLSYRVMLATKWRLPPQDEYAACATTPGIRQGSRWSIDTPG
jgi:hypothetical protein